MREHDKIFAVNSEDRVELAHDLRIFRVWKQRNDDTRVQVLQSSAQLGHPVSNRFQQG